MWANHLAWFDKGLHLSACETGITHTQKQVIFIARVTHGRPDSQEQADNFTACGLVWTDETCVQKGAEPFSN